MTTDSTCTTGGKKEKQKPEDTIDRREVRPDEERAENSKFRTAEDFPSAF
jgi:hypothetical protein